MESYFEKYAELLLVECLKVKEGEPLYVQIPAERYDFARVLVKFAYKIGIKDVEVKFSDEYIKHEELNHLTFEELKEIEWWSGKKLAQAANKNAAVLSLRAEYPGLNNDVDSNLLNKLSKSIYQEALPYYSKVLSNNIAWCIAAVPSQDWADKLFPDDPKSLEKLWKTILDICLVTKDSPLEELKSKVAISSKRADKINKMNIKYLKYTNSLGTNLTIEMPDNYIFHNIEMKLQDGRIILPNMPSEEIYSSPLKCGTNGIVYASRPLVHNGKAITNFWLKFEEGKVVDFGAEKEYDELKEIVNCCENSDFLGEVALVDFNSPISNTKMLFYTTLFDENASCHLALGESFADAIVGGLDMNKEELENCGLNQCNNHVDFMIGTEDLKIIAITRDNQEISIFENGSFTF